MSDEPSQRRSTVERVELDRVVPAKREDTAERRSSEADTRREIRTRQRRAAEDHSHLLESLQSAQAQLEREKAQLELELRARSGQLAESAEREVTLDDRIKRSSLANTVITTVIASLTALGSVGWWGYNRMQAQALAAASEDERRKRVTEQLEDAEESVRELQEDLNEHKRQQQKVNEEQYRVNNLQLLRGQRIESLIEISLRRQGRTPPKKSPELQQAECATGLVDDPLLCLEFDP